MAWFILVYYLLYILLIGGVADWLRNLGRFVIKRSGLTQAMWGKLSSGGTTSVVAGGGDDPSNIYVIYI